jgi:sugar phosphate isomerase/epimerase
MPAPIALQLYSVREIAKNDYAGTVKKVAEMGYVGVEPAGFPGSNVDDAVKIYQDLGLTVCSAHLPMPIGAAKNEALDLAAKLGCKRMVSGFGPDAFATKDKIKETCAKFNEASANAKAAGRQFGIHNHWWEYIEIEGEYVYKQMMKHLSPDVLFELDCYWIKTGGPDPAAVVREVGARAPLLHIKDGPCKKGEPMTAVGDGIIDWAPVVQASAGTAEWLIVELDSCKTDMMEAVRKSYNYLVGRNLARGNK